MTIRASYKVLNRKVRICSYRFFAYVSGISTISIRKVLWIILFLSVITGFPLLIRLTLHNFTSPPVYDDMLEELVVDKKRAILEKKLIQAQRKLNSKTPRTAYLVINSSINEFSLHRGNQVIKTGKCSTGSYILLKNGEDQQWMFKTPKGEFRIQGKTTSPVWRKPDWAFVEEGLPVPAPYHYSRYEYGVLGDYALSLGDGYLIHGTLYQRFLGLPVTHGCVRMGDEDLEIVYHSLTIGSKVYIY